jgi:uncharacterized membrane protein YeiB
MHKTLWALQILLAFSFAAAGTIKLSTPQSQFASDPNMSWAEDYSDTQIKLIGAAEVAGAIGLVAPMATGLLPVLTPLAGAGLALLMGGAVSTHLSRGEPPYAPLVLGALAAAVAAGRWRTARSRA